MEQSRLEEVGLDLPACLVAESATEILATTVGARSVTPPEDPIPPRYWHCTATANLAAMGLRSGRACMAVVCHGYAPESLGLLRRVAEAVDYARWIYSDPSGQRAERWVTADPGQKKGPRSVAGLAGRMETFDLYSQAAHADARAAHQLNREGDREDWVSILAVPEHNRGLSNAVLAELAEDCARMARQVTTAWEDEQPGLAEVEELSRRTVDRYGSPSSFLGTSNPYVEPK